jgi:hypothetical protein
LKGHDFSRAVTIAKYTRALAPEGILTYCDRSSRCYLKHVALAKVASLA